MKMGTVVSTSSNSGGRKTGEFGAPEAASAPQIHYEHDGIRIGSFRNVALVHWGSHATVDAVRALSVCSADLLKRYERISVAQVIPDNVGVPTEQARAMLLKLADAGAGRIACIAYVLAGDGFWASAMRSLVTNSSWVGQRSFVPRICATLQEAATWLAPLHNERTQVFVDTASLLRVLNNLSGASTPPDADASPMARPSVPRRRPDND